ncbi:MAG TPA: PrsW family glutamic-type intramembrane protease [Nostocaceae cyanobacterium]|nr:PrsW family glutamic-type intramembrane protease [Nostocaceae cyanobacterium]
MDNLSVVFWAIIPPLVLLWFYYRRTPAAPPFLQLLLLFMVGAIAGLFALGLEYGVEYFTNQILVWQQFQRSLWGAAIRQLVEIGPIEEGCKFIAVVVATYYLQRRYTLRARTIFLFTIAVALGFTAEENGIYLYNGTASIVERLIGTPVHAMFSAPWGYALGVYVSASIFSRLRLKQRQHLLPLAWLNSVFFHALVNVISLAWGYPPPTHYLGYGLFPLLLWLFWRLEQLLRKAQDKPPRHLVSGRTLQERYWQRALILFSLLLGGNALFGFFILAKKLTPLQPAQLLEPDIAWFIVRQLMPNMIFAGLAWLTYRYLHNLARRRSFSSRFGG